MVYQKFKRRNYNIDQLFDAVWRTGSHMLRAIGKTDFSIVVNVVFFNRYGPFFKNKLKTHVAVYHII